MQLVLNMNLKELTRQRWFVIWIIGSAIAFIFAKAWGGYGYYFVLPFAIILCQSISVVFLKKGKAKLLWFLGVPAYLVIIKVISITNYLSADMVFGLSFLVVIFSYQFLVWRVFDKRSVYWILYNSLAVTATVGLWFLRNQVSLSFDGTGFLYLVISYLTEAVLGLVFGFVSAIGIWKSQLNDGEP